MSSNPDWMEVPPLGFEFRGGGKSSIQFVAEAVLAKRVSISGAFVYRTTITIDAPCALHQHTFEFTTYESVRRLRSKLAAIRKGTEELATLNGQRFAMMVGLHKTRIREGLLVQGVCTTFDDLQKPPWPEYEPVGDSVLRDRAPAANYRFSFESSLVDPPYLDQAISGIDDIIRYLESEGYEP